MLSNFEKALVLRDVPIFAATSPDHLTQVAALMEEVELEAGETVFRQGDIGDCMYIIVSGTMRMHQDDYVLAERSEREMFGEMALLETAPRLASATAVSDCLLLRLDQEPFFELLEGDNDVVRGIMHVLTRRLSTITDRINQLQLQHHTRTGTLANENDNSFRL